MIDRAVGRVRCASLVGVSALLLMTAPAFAQSAGQAQPPPENDDTLTIGAGIGYTPSYEGSDDYVLIPAAAVRGKVSGHNFYTRGTQFYFDAIPEGPGNSLDISLGPVAAVRLNRTRRIKDPQVRALGKLDTAIEVGAFAGIAKTGVITSDYDTLSFRVAYLRDVTDTHDSYVLTPTIEYGTPLSPTAYVGLSLSAERVGDGYARTYFDVTPAGAAASGLPVYSTDGGWKNVSVGLLGTVSLSGDLRKGWALFAVGNYSKLLGDFKRSPIVSVAGSSNQWLGAIGIGYTF
ncbi:MAG: MipA/OmpV family protein [Sphingobium sp.]